MLKQTKFTCEHCNSSYDNEKECNACESKCKAIVTNKSKKAEKDKALLESFYKVRIESKSFSEFQDKINALLEDYYGEPNMLRIDYPEIWKWNQTPEGQYCFNVSIRYKLSKTTKDKLFNNSFWDVKEINQSRLLITLKIQTGSGYGINHNIYVYQCSFNLKDFPGIESAIAKADAKIAELNSELYAEALCLAVNAFEDDLVSIQRNAVINLQKRLKELQQELKSAEECLHESTEKYRKQLEDKHKEGLVVISGIHKQYGSTVLKNNLIVPNVDWLKLEVR